MPYWFKVTLLLKFLAILATWGEENHFHPFKSSLGEIDEPPKWLFTPSVFLFTAIDSIQWRIQDFPGVGAPTSKVGVKSYYLVNFFPENCMKIKEIGPRGRVSGTPSPSFGSANAIALSFSMASV